jgi:hypothetical protein
MPKRADASKAWGKMKYAAYDQTMDIKRQHDASLATPAGAKPKKSDSSSNWGRMKYASYENVMNETIQTHEDNPPQRNDDVPVIRAKSGTLFGAKTTTVGKATGDIKDVEYLSETTDNIDEEDSHTFDSYKATVNVSRGNNEMEQKSVKDETEKWVRSDDEVVINDGFDEENVVLTEDEGYDETEAPPIDEAYKESYMIAEEEECEEDPGDCRR